MLYRSRYLRKILDLNNDDSNSMHMEKAIKNMNEANFHYTKFKTGVLDVTTGHMDGFQTHFTEVQAHRRSIKANMLLVFPIVFLLGVVFCTYFLPIAGEARFIVTGIAMCGNLILNYSVISYLPQTGYASRLGILMMFNYIWILWTFLWHATTRIMYHGVDALLAKLQHHELDVANNGKTFPVHTTEGKDPAYTATVGYGAMFDVTVASLPSRICKIHVCDVVGRSIFFVFTVISTCVVLARYIH